MLREHETLGAKPSTLTMSPQQPTVDEYLTEDGIHTRTWLLRETIKRCEYNRFDVLLKELSELRLEHEKLTTRRTAPQSAVG